MLLNGGRMQVSPSLRFKGLFLYTIDVLFYVEWCIRQPRCSSIILYNITSIAYNHYTDIYPLFLNSIQPQDSLGEVVSSIRENIVVKRATTLGQVQGQVRVHRGSFFPCDSL